jgi:hypothetical protein
MTNTKPMIYLKEGHVTGHTLPLHPTVADRWKRGELVRVNEDGSDWEGDPYALPGGEPAVAETTASGTDDDGPEPVRPKGNASRIAWAGYAVALGACDEDEADTLTRDQLIALTTAPEMQASQGE